MLWSLMDSHSAFVRDVAQVWVNLNNKFCGVSLQFCYFIIIFYSYGLFACVIFQD